jgi:hypothetical protein
MGGEARPVGGILLYGMRPSGQIREAGGPRGPHVEEIRLGRHELAASTMYKRKKDDSPTLID